MRGTTVKLISFQPEGDQSGRGTSFSCTPNDTHFSCSRWMSVVGLSLSLSTSTGPRSARHGASVLRNYLSRPFISSLVFLGSLCPRGVQNITRVFRRLSVHLVTWPAPLLHLNFLIRRFHDISYFRVYYGQPQPTSCSKIRTRSEILQKLPKAARLFLKVAQKLLINTAIFAIYHKTDAVMHT